MLADTLLPFLGTPSLAVYSRPQRSSAAGGFNQSAPLHSKRPWTDRASRQPKGPRGVSPRKGSYFLKIIGFEAFTTPIVCET